MLENPKDVNEKLFKPEQCHFIGEQIIFAKTKKSGGVKQCNPQKIHK